MDMDARFAKEKETLEQKGYSPHKSQLKLHSNLQASILCGCGVLDEHVNNIWLDLRGWLLQVSNLYVSFLFKPFRGEARVPTCLNGFEKPNKVNKEIVIQAR